MKKTAKGVLSAVFLLGFLLFFYAAYRTVFGISYLAKYLYYDNHSWGTIEYRSDKMTATGEYRIQTDPSYINMQMSLDEPVDGEEIFSITFKHIDAREDNIGDCKGARALAVYSELKGSKGDIITKADIITSLICGGYAVIFIIVFIILIARSRPDENEIEKKIKEIQGDRNGRI